MWVSASALGCGLRRCPRASPPEPTQPSCSECASTVFCVSVNVKFNKTTLFPRRLPKLYKKLITKYQYKLRPSFSTLFSIRRPMPEMMMMNLLSHLVTFGTTSALHPSIIKAISSTVMFGCSCGEAAPSHASSPKLAKLRIPQNQKVAGQPKLGLPAKRPEIWKITIVPNWEPVMEQLKYYFWVSKLSYSER